MITITKPYLRLLEISLISIRGTIKFIYSHSFIIDENLIRIDRFSICSYPFLPIIVMFEITERIGSLLGNQWLRNFFPKI